MNVTHLYCSCCGKEYEPRHLYNLCDRDKPLILAYDLKRVQATLSPKSLSHPVPSLWRYQEVLPVSDCFWEATR